MRTRLLFAALVLLSFSTMSTNVLAVGAWIGGQDILHVPMSWCIVNGSPAQTMPNINGDTDTDAIIWRRHERPTDNILKSQAGISLRSAINNAWGSFNFPLINDPFTGNVCGAANCVTTSDIRGEDVNVVGAEFNNMINACETAYNNIGKAGIGITAVNLGLYHDGVPNYVGVIGWGGCAEFPAGTCIAPYDGLAAMIDNRYLFPSSPNRTFPGNNPSTGFAFILTDPFDGLTAHEVGHALSLDHRNNNTALMNPGITDNNADGQADNIALNNAEVAALRANAMNVPGLEIDPPGVFNPGPFLAEKVPTAINPQLRPDLDIAGVRAFLDKDTGNAGFEVRLAGLLPQDVQRPTDFWILVDGDTRGEGGCTSEQLKEIGVPLPGALRSPTLAILLQAIGVGELKHQAWSCLDNNPRDITELLRPLIATFAVYPHFAETNEKQPAPVPKDDRFPIHNILRVDIPKDVGPFLEQRRPLAMEALVVENNEIIDIGGRGEGDGLPMLLDDPQFPHCFPQAAGVPGEKVAIDVDNFGKQNGGAPIHGLLGAMAVFNGFLDNDGNALVDLPVPPATTPGPHLVTIGIDGTALTADCTVTVLPGDPGGKCPGDFDADGDVDRTDARTFSLDFGRRDCRIQ